MWRKEKQQLSAPFNPGEFEMLTTTASREWWQRGKILLTNHRLFWTPNKTTANQPAIEIDLQQVLGCTEIRSIFYLFMKPALRVLLSTGKSLDFHDVKELGALKLNIEKVMGRERYTPGSLFPY
jgi:Vacuolar protein sorting protein 36 Vps36